MNDQKLIQLYKSIEVSMNAVTAEIKARNLDWQFLAEHDLKVMAIMAYRERHKCDLLAAKFAVEEFKRNQLVALLVKTGK